MGFFSRRKTAEPRDYDKTRKTPAIRESICTGEQVAGFLDNRTGKFEEVMLLRTAADLDAFKKQYGITGEVKKFN